MCKEKDLSGHLAYSWDDREKKIEKLWLPAITPPDSFKAVAEKVERAKNIKNRPLLKKERRGKIKDI